MSNTPENRINIQIKLSNNLLCAALKEMLVKESALFDTGTPDHPADCSEYGPRQAIIVDENSLINCPRDLWPEAKIMLLDNGIGEERIINMLINCRIDGVISTNTDIELFKKAIFAVDKGQVWIDNAKLKALLNHVEGISNAPQQESLSKREKDIIILLSQGLRNKEIADRICISEQTVKSHLSRIFRKTNVTSRSQLVPLALKFTAPSA